MKLVQFSLLTLTFLALQSGITFAMEKENSAVVKSKGQSFHFRIPFSTNYKKKQEENSLNEKSFVVVKDEFLTKVRTPHFSQPNLYPNLFTLLKNIKNRCDHIENFLSGTEKLNTKLLSKNTLEKLLTDVYTEISLLPANDLMAYKKYLNGFGKEVIQPTLTCVNAVDLGSKGQFEIWLQRTLGSKNVPLDKGYELLEFENLQEYKTFDTPKIQKQFKELVKKYKHKNENLLAKIRQAYCPLRVRITREMYNAFLEKDDPNGVIKKQKNLQGLNTEDFIKTVNSFTLDPIAEAQNKVNMRIRKENELNQPELTEQEVEKQVQFARRVTKKIRNLRALGQPFLLTAIKEEVTKEFAIDSNVKHAKNALFKNIGGILNENLTQWDKQLPVAIAYINSMEGLRNLANKQQSHNQNIMHGHTIKVPGQIVFQQKKLTHVNSHQELPLLGNDLD